MNAKELSKMYIYIITNKYMPNVVKIGFTARPVEERLKEFNTDTSSVVLRAFEIFATFETTVKDYDKKIHSVIDFTNPELRADAGREFYEMSPNDAYELLTKIHDLAPDELFDGVRYTKAQEDIQNFNKKIKERDNAKDKLIAETFSLINDEFKKAKILDIPDTLKPFDATNNVASYTVIKNVRFQTSLRKSNKEFHVVITPYTNSFAKTQEDKVALIEEIKSALPNCDYVCNTLQKYYADNSKDISTVNELSLGYSIKVNDYNNLTDDELANIIEKAKNCIIAITEVESFIK